jgi:hypothetical protein
MSAAAPATSARPKPFMNAVRVQQKPGPAQFPHHEQGEAEDPGTERSDRKRVSPAPLGALDDSAHDCTEPRNRQEIQHLLNSTSVDF